jgi:hypothetical protein
MIKYKDKWERTVLKHKREGEIHLDEYKIEVAGTKIRKVRDKCPCILYNVYMVHSRD